MGTGTAFWVSVLEAGPGLCLFLVWLLSGGGGGNRKSELPSQLCLRRHCLLVQTPPSPSAKGARTFSSSQIPTARAGQPNRSLRVSASRLRAKA